MCITHTYIYIYIYICIERERERERERDPCLGNTGVPELQDGAARAARPGLLQHHAESLQ